MWNILKCYITAVFFSKILSVATRWWQQWWIKICFFSYSGKFRNIVSFSFVLQYDTANSWQVNIYYFSRLILSTFNWKLNCMNRTMLSIVMYIPGEDDESRLIRKTLCQNCNLMIVLLLRTISASVRSKYKSIDDLVKAGNSHFI